MISLFCLIQFELNLNYFATLRIMTHKCIFTAIWVPGKAKPLKFVNSEEGRQRKGAMKSGDLEIQNIGQVDWPCWLGVGSEPLGVTHGRCEFKGMKQKVADIDCDTLWLESHGMTTEVTLPEGVCASYPLWFSAHQDCIFFFISWILICHQERQW